MNSLLLIQIFGCGLILLAVLLSQFKQWNPSGKIKPGAISGRLMKIKVLLNPYSNRWNAQKRWPEAEAALKSAGVDFDLSVSEHPDHLIDLAADAVKQGFSTIVIAGGDGSIGEVVNGIAHHWNGKDKFPANLELFL